MIKVVSIPLCFLLLCAATSPAQVSPSDTAINEAVLRQANTIVLQQTLAEAKRAVARHDLVNAAKLYGQAYDLTQRIGSGINTETAEAISGVVSTRLALARLAQSHGDYHSADLEVIQVLKVDPQNPVALAFKKANDHQIALMAGKIPDASTIERIPNIQKEKISAGTLVQDGKLLYEMGKLDDADAKLKAALQLDPNNQAAFYYLNLIKQARYTQESLEHTADTQNRMNQVEKQWVLPTSHDLPEVANPYATNDTVYTGPGRSAIMAKLDSIHIDNISYDGLPLGEVLRDLSTKAQLRDPEKKGINFLINPNADNSGIAPAPVVTATGTGGGGGAGGGLSIGALGGEPGRGGVGGPGGGPVATDPTTGLPVAATAAEEPVDIGNDVLIKLSLSDVRLADVIDAIVLVANKPIKYSVRDYAIVFQSRDTRFEPPLLTVRVFKVDPNTFYSGLESVTAESFGSVSSSGSGSSGGSGGGSSGGSSGSSGNNNSGGVVGVVDAVPGASQARSSGGNSGGGGGGGGAQGAAGANPLDRGGVPGAASTASSSGGLRYVSKVDLAADVSLAARNFFNTLGINLDYPKSVFFNDRLGLLMVRATEQDLDTIEQALQALNRVAPQVHIKARFIEVQQTDNKALGFEWYLGNFVNGSVVASGGSQPSLYNSSGQAFPSSDIAASSTDQQVTSGLRNTLNAPALATVTGILTDPNFRAVINALQQRSGVETLAEPEAVTTSGRQTQMKATTLKTVITGANFTAGTSATTTTGSAVP